MKNVSSISILLLTGILAACGTPTQATPMPTPTPTPFVARGVIHPGDQVGGMSITNEESKHFIWIYDLCNFDWSRVVPNSQTVPCTVTEVAAIGIGTLWGAETAKFNASLEPISWELYVDDYRVLLDEFGYFDLTYYDPSAGFDVTYRNWNVLLRNLAAGRHTLRFSYTLVSEVNDGWTTYPPGKYEYVADLTVTAKPVYPSLPTVAKSGQHAYTTADGRTDFLLYMPESYGTDPAKKWPLIVYLHDAEYRGNPDYLLRESLPKRLGTVKDFSFLVLSPVGSGDMEFWSTKGMMEAVLSVLGEIQSLYAVDPKRIYLTGAGMGGNGVWTMGMQHPDVFAALAPLGGYVFPFGVPEDICNLTDVPVWAIHGEEDFMVPPKVEQDLVNAVNACGGTAKFTVKAGAVIPLDVYYGSELFDWLLSHSKK